MYLLSLSVIFCLSHSKEIVDFVLNSKRLIYITIRGIWISTFRGTSSVKVFSFSTIIIWKVKYFGYLSRVTDSSPLLFIQEINLALSRFRSPLHIYATSRRCQNERSKLSTLISEVQITYGYWFHLFLKYLFLSFSYRNLRSIHESTYFLLLAALSYCCQVFIWNLFSFALFQCKTSAEL